MRSKHEQLKAAIAGNLRDRRRRKNDLRVLRAGPQFSGGSGLSRDEMIQSFAAAITVHNRAIRMLRRLYRAA